MMRRIAFGTAIFLVAAGVMFGAFSLYLTNLAREASFTAEVNQYWLYQMQYGGENYNLTQQYIREREQSIALHDKEALYYQTIASYSNSFASLAVAVGAILFSVFPRSHVPMTEPVARKPTRKKRSAHGNNRKKRQVGK